MDSKYTVVQSSGFHHINTCISPKCSIQASLFNCLVDTHCLFSEIRVFFYGIGYEDGSFENTLVLGIGFYQLTIAC
jgi:hypothetical protein